MIGNDLGSNEQAELAAASRIFSGLAANASFTKKNHHAAYNYSLQTALQMAKAINKSIKVQILTSGEILFPL